MSPTERVAVFIDHSNVFHNLHDLKSNGSPWRTSFYDPLILAQQLAGGRLLESVLFYCTPPPQYLMNERETEWKFKKTMRYYTAVEKLPKVILKYGTLQGLKGNMTEKNLDTQIATDMVTMAALNELDVVILISNDGDFQSALETVRVKFHKRTEVLFFKGSLSMALRKASDLTRRARPSHFVRINAQLNEEERGTA